MIEIFEPSRHLTGIGGRLVVLTSSSKGNRLSRLGSAYHAIAPRGDHRVVCIPVGSSNEQAIRVEVIAVVCDTLDEVESVQQVSGHPRYVKNKIMIMAGLPVDEDLDRKRDRRRGLRRSKPKRQ